MKTAYSDCFDLQIEKGLRSCGIRIEDVFAGDSRRLGLGVSGGADSVALLTACIRIRSKFAAEGGIPRIYVITVNHNIRSEEESCGDAFFVEEYCRSFPNICCTVVNIDRGEVRKCAGRRKKGVEEAARCLRYEAFSHFISQNKIDFFLLAHSRNDQAETVLMRFFQGSSGVSLSGIRQAREPFFRPMLDIPRFEIERYLTELSVPYRTDSSNSDSRYLRNRIRLRLVPLLDDLLPGWDKAVLSAAEKCGEDGAFLDDAAAVYVWRRGICSEDADALCIEAAVFDCLSAAVRRRLVYSALSELKSGARFPYALIKKVVSGSLPFRAKGFEFYRSGEYICVGKIKTTRKKQGFFAIITEPGRYLLGSFLCTAERYKQNDVDGACVQGQGCAEAICLLPACVRTSVPGDEKTARMQCVKDGPEGLAAEHMPVCGTDPVLCRIRVGWRLS